MVGILFSNFPFGAFRPIFRDMFDMLVFGRVRLCSLLTFTVNRTYLYIESTPHPGFQSPPGIITCLVGNRYKPSFVTVTGWGVDQTSI